MKKTKLLSICIAIGGCILLTDFSYAQTVINKNNIEDLYSKNFDIESFVSTDTDKILSLTDSTGAGQTWNFSELTFIDSLVSTSDIEISTEISEAPLSDDPHFSQATHVLRSQVITDTLSFSSYTYQQLNDTALVSLGSVIFFEGESNPSSILFNRPGSIDFILPAAFLDSWQFINETEIQFSGSSQLSSADITAEVDAWGTLITPEGEFQVLRIKQEEVTSSFGIEFKSIEYKFVNSAGAQLANITADEIQFVGIDLESVQATVNKITEELTTSNESLRSVPGQFILEQNYPNPFNPSTTIAFSLPETGPVQILIYDMLGREVVGSLLNRTMSAGRHQISFDASTLSSGIYLYQIQAGTFQQTRKMTLIK